MVLKRVVVPLLIAVVGNSPSSLISVNSFAPILPKLKGLHYIDSSSVLFAKGKGDSPLDLKAELTAYLEKRREQNADEVAKKEVGKVVGGTKGNLVLDFVSGSPNKEFVIEEVPDVFDYDELSKYGYDYLVVPIMDAGGRQEMYSLMGMPAPPPRQKLQKKSAPPLRIDRTGETDPGRYSGLKVTQIIDDEEMGRQLAAVQSKQKRGESLRSKIEEEDYVMPFADKRNTGPRQTPDWTPEKLDEEGRKAGRAQAWAKASRAGEFRKDPFEQMNIEGSLQLYCIFAASIASISWGRATPKALSLLGIDNEIISPLQIPGLVLIAAAFGSSIACAALLAPEKNRNSFIWAVKGFAGGPLAVLQLRGLDALKTIGELEEINSSK